MDESKSFVLWFEELLSSLPALSALTFNHPICWAIMKICLARPRIVSLSFSPRAAFYYQKPFLDQDVATYYSSNIQRFCYNTPLWREAMMSNTRAQRGLGTIDERYSREASSMSALVPRMCGSMRELVVPLETAPLLSMTEVSWPELRSLSLHGRYRNPSQVDALPPFLRSLSQMTKLSLLVCRKDAIGRAPILGRHSPASILSGLRSLTLTYPDPEDGIFSVDATSLFHLCLRDYPRYYHHLGQGAKYGKWGSPILSSAECLSILKRMNMPLLRTLELVYLADTAGSDDELIEYVVDSYPHLSHLELHRYRSNREEEVEHVSRSYPLMSSQLLLKLTTFA